MDGQGPAATRRSLDFRDFDAVLAEVDRLHAGGYATVGRWDLAQALGHLGDWMRFPLDGYPPMAWPVRAALAVLRPTLGRRGLRKALETRALPGGGPTLPATVPEPGGDEAGAVARFREVVDRFRSHAGPMHPSPLFGDIGREDATQLHLIHCAHHLGYLIPRRG